MDGSGREEWTRIGFSTCCEEAGDDDCEEVDDDSDGLDGTGSERRDKLLPPDGPAVKNGHPESLVKGKR